MAEASSIDEDLKKGLCRRLGTLKANVAPVFDDLITDLVENGALGWEERNEIKAYPGQYRQTDRLIEIIIDNNRMRPFIEAFRKFNPEFVDTIYHDEQIIASDSEPTISQRLARLELVHQNRQVREDKLYNKLEEIMQSGVNQMVDVFQQKISHITEENSQKLDESIDKIDQHITDFRATFKELMQDLQKVTVNGNLDENIEKNVTDKYDKIEMKYVEIEEENKRLLGLQMGLRQRIIRLEERLTKLHRENASLKSELGQSTIQLEKSDATLLTRENEIKDLKDKMLVKDKYISYIEKELQLIQSKNAQLRTDMKNLNLYRMPNAGNTRENEIQIQGNVCGFKRK